MKNGKPGFSVVHKLKFSLQACSSTALLYYVEHKVSELDVKVKYIREGR